jgi:Holliday junction DNA helicase RuvB
MADRPISPDRQATEIEVEVAIRPRRLKDFIGQDNIKENLDILVEAARARGQSLDHVLLYGPPGLGKTTLAHIVATEMETNIKITAGPVIEKAGDLAAILTNLQQGDILFIDEIHRLRRTMEEILYPAMEDRVLDLMIGTGPSARSVRLPLSPFTIVGTTTRLAMMTSPLRSRFGVTYRLEFYDLEAMRTIVKRAAALFEIEITDEGSQEISSRARGTPRIANRLLRRVRDYAQVRADGRITRPVAQAALALLEVDSLGLDSLDHKVLDTLINKFGGGPVGLETIAASISEESDTIMDVVEPYLLQLGFLERTPRGRMASRLAYEHLGIPYLDDTGCVDQAPLF